MLLIKLKQRKLVFIKNFLDRGSIPLISTKNTLALAESEILSFSGECKSRVLLMGMPGFDRELYRFIGARQCESRDT